MDCPRCSAEMGPLGEELIAERCMECGGLFIDEADLTRILLHNNQPGLDRLGGRENLETITAQCPECHVDLSAVEGGDRKSPVHYERCEVCGGVWLPEAGLEREDDSPTVRRKVLDFYKRFRVSA